MKAFKNEGLLAKLNTVIAATAIVSAGIVLAIYMLYKVHVKDKFVESVARKKDKGKKVA